MPTNLSHTLVAALYVVQNKTEMGRALYAIGGNERASRIAGISVDYTKIMLFVINGMCAALGGFFLAAKLRSSAPKVGDSFTLLIVASVALGGTSLTGGARQHHGNHHRRFHSVGNPERNEFHRR